MDNPRRRISLFSLLLIFLITLLGTTPFQSVQAEDPDYVWVLVGTEVNPTDAKSAFFGGGQW